jgi:lysophospholipase L1-like esterase
MVASWEKTVPVEAASLAKSGRTTSEIYPMVQGDAGNHDLLVVELGTNDVYKSTPERFQTDYPKYLDAVRAASPQAALVCAGVWKRSPVQLAMDSTIETECTKRGGRFVPLSAFYGEAQYMSKPGIPHWDGAKTDGNHPNDAGHRKIADALLAAVSVS